MLAGTAAAACLGTATLPRRRLRAAGPVPDAELAQDKGQFLPDEMMPSSGPATALAVDKLAGNITKPVNISLTYTNSFAIAANNLERYTK